MSARDQERRARADCVVQWWRNDPDGTSRGLSDQIVLEIARAVDAADAALVAMRHERDHYQRGNEQLRQMINTCRDTQTGLRDERDQAQAALVTLNDALTDLVEQIMAHSGTMLDFEHGEPCIDVGMLFNLERVDAARALIKTRGVKGNG